MSKKRTYLSNVNDYRRTTRALVEEESCKEVTIVEEESYKEVTTTKLSKPLQLGQFEFHRTTPPISQAI